MSVHAGLLARIVDAVAAWQQRARDRRTLNELSEHQRRDIGLSREQIESEVSKPSWRD